MNMIFGTFTVAGLNSDYPPNVADFAGRYAYCSDKPGGAGFMVCDGVSWTSPLKRVETFAGTTDATGNYSITYSPAYGATPHVSPVIYPPGDSITRVRLTAASATGFTVKTEKNATVNLLGVDILGIGTGNVASVPVRVLVVES